MLFVLTGDIQIGKTRWLQGVTAELAERGVPCAGVIAPGVWVKSEAGDANGFEKLGIDNLLLPQGELVHFARRRDLAQAEGSFDPHSQSARARLSWEISDEAISRVNKHFARIAAGDASPAANPTPNKGPGLLIVDELGRLELLRNEGLTQALSLLDAGPSEAFPHALIVVRETLLPQATERFAPTWGAPCAIGPTDAARARLFSTLGV